MSQWDLLAQRMRIGIDASRATVARRTGTESYSLRIIQGLLEQGSAHDFILYFRDTPEPGLFPAGPGRTLRVMPFPRLWTHVRLSLELAAASFALASRGTPAGHARRKLRPDVLFVPAHALPLAAAANPLRSVVTVHDLGYRHLPHAHPLLQRLYLDWSTSFSVHAAERVIAVSQATCRDLVRFYRVPEHKIAVVYEGRDESLRPVDPAPVRAKYGLAGDYLLHVGTLQPRKNLPRLIEATQHVTRGTQYGSRLTLVLAGRPGWLSAPILALARERGVRVLDYVPDDDLSGLYSGALALVFPSLYEGFGFPVLEAMSCGVPVVCSNASSLPELAGEAALLVDPTDTRALASAILRVLTEPGLRETLIAKGFEQVRRFSWAHAARETLAVLEEAARGDA